jgi:hypothetical protein
MNTRMILVRLCDGSLWINSPVEATAAEMEAVARLGPVRYLVAPTPLHAWRVASWKTAFPDAEVWGPAELGNETPAPWAQDLDQVVFRGNSFLDEVEFLHKPSRTLILGDFVQIYRSQEHRPVRNAMLKLAGVLGGGVPRDIRLSFRDKTQGRLAAGKILSWDFDKLIVAHGDCIESGAKPFVAQALRWLG